MLKGVIFDAGGTLLDSMFIWNELGQRYLAKHNIKAEADLSEILYSMSLEESSRYLKETYGLPDPVERITEEILTLIRSFYTNEVTLKTGVADYIRYLHEQKSPCLLPHLTTKHYFAVLLHDCKLTVIFRRF